MVFVKLRYIVIVCVSACLEMCPWVWHCASGCIAYRKVDSPIGRWNIGRWKVDYRKMAANRNVIEYPLAMLWRHRRAFTRKITGFETTIVITRTILKLNSWDFLMTSTILLLKLLMSSNNSLWVTVLSLRLSKDRKNRFVINDMLINKH